MNKRKILCILAILGAILFLSPESSVYAQENADDYIMVDAQTGERKVIDLEKEGYDDLKQFVSNPSFTGEFLNNGYALANSRNDSIGTASIIGTDDRWKITNTDQYPYTTIARISVIYQDGTNACGTGAMINPRLLATAGHLLINSNGSHPRTIKMQFGQNGYWDYFYQTFNRPTEADYGFIVFNDDTVSKSTGYMGIRTVPSNSDKLYTAGYPDAMGTYYMYGATGDIIRMNGDLIYHNMDTQKGQSGSPVYIIGSNGYPYLVAMHSTSSVPENIARRLDPGLFYWLQDNGYID